MVRTPHQSAALPCPHCGYDLRGRTMASDPAVIVCPECGNRVNVEPPKPVPYDAYPLHIGPVRWCFWILLLMPALIPPHTYSGNVGYLASLSAERAMILSVLPAWYIALALHMLRRNPLWLRLVLALPTAGMLFLLTIPALVLATVLWSVAGVP